MRILLRWLVENAWILYVLCAIGALVYFARMLGAARERRLAVFSLERETAGSRVVQSLVTALIFAGLGALIYVATTRVLPVMPMFNSEVPEATATPSAGLEFTAIPDATATASEVLTTTPSAEVLLPTFTPTPGEEAAAPVADSATEVPGEEATEEPTPEPSATPDQLVSGQLNTRFGAFGALVAYSVSGGPHSSQEPLALFLYWQALDQPSPADYIVFTHLIASDGHLIAQHDGAPAGGARPLSGWASGESITDPHYLQFLDTAYAGPATLRVGLYDAGTGDRALTDGGADYVVLPVTIEVTP